MIDLLSLYSDQWPSFDPQRHLYALDAHCARYAEWLLRAGAEPRLSLVLCSGDVAFSGWKERMQTMGILLKSTPTSIEQPLHEDFLLHQGDHFNRTLFYMEIDAVDASDIQELLILLNGRRNQLKKTATWVALVIKNPKTLDALWESATQLARMIQRRCWVWHPDDLNDDSFKAILNYPKFPVGTPLIDELFALAKRPHLPISYLNFSRLLRLGSPYAPKHAEKQWKELYELWANEDAEGFDHPSGQTSILAMIKKLDQHLPRDERKHLANHLPKDLSWMLGLSPKAPTSMDEYWRELGRCARGELELPLAEIKRLSQLWEGLETWLQGPAGLWLSASFAHLNEIEQCIEFLNKTTLQKSIPEEIRFEAHQKLAQIYTFLNERQKAKEEIDQLFEIADLLYSPCYRAQAFYDRSLFLSTLDTSGAQKDQKDGKYLALTQGWILE